MGRQQKTSGLDITPGRGINSDVMNNRPLQNQVALVTGAGKRLGRAIALTLARAGANLAVHYHESKQGAQASVREIERLGGQAIAVRADVSRPREVAAMMRAVERRFRGLDILVNNAGVFYAVKWDQLTGVDWDKVLGINLKGAFFCAQAAARVMRRRGHGRIIIISSLGGLQAWPDYIHYCASKAGVISLTRCLAKALAPRIQVNSVAPGTILFPGERRDARMEGIIRSTPLRKAGRPEDIAEMVLFLATRSDFITGQVFAVDGGKSIA
jgi:NAD(P)-dependent dehydrogenase (short-subunit alcohol dehydrogenase family)